MWLEPIVPNLPDSNNVIKTLRVQLEDIFKKSIDKKLFRSNTKLEDFLYVFDDEEKPNRFTKLYAKMSIK